MSKVKGAALLLHSGGQDSTTCLAWALKTFSDVRLISFDYGQRHRVELEASAHIADHLGLDHTIISLPFFSELGANALTDSSVEIDPGDDTHLPSTFVPGRNLIFLTVAAQHAHSLGITNLVTGVCQTDYSGYPDCREDFIQSAQQTLRLAMETPFEIHAPLMHLTKAQTVQMMIDLGQLDLLQYSHTCYEGLRPACGKCPACLLRLKGFEEAGVKDPIRYAN